MYTYICCVVLAIYFQTGIQLSANRVSSWSQFGVNLNQIWIHLNSMGPIWGLMGPSGLSRAYGINEPYGRIGGPHGPIWGPWGPKSTSHMGP